VTVSVVPILDTFGARSN